MARKKATETKPMERKLKKAKDMLESLTLEPKFQTVQPLLQYEFLAHLGAANKMIEDFGKGAYHHDFKAMGEKIVTEASKSITILKGMYTFSCGGVSASIWSQLAHVERWSWRFEVSLRWPLSSFRLA